jgi:membrane-associated phospholipid phosphatase
MENVVLIILFLISVFFYIPLNKRKSKYYWKLKLDEKIPLLSIFVIPYVFYFVYFVLAFLLIFDSVYFSNFLVFLIIGNILNSIFWYIFPNGVKRPDLKPKNVFEKLLLLIYKRDKYDGNGCPSAHVFHSLTLSLFLSWSLPEYSILFWSLGILVSMSTVFVKQHYIIDVVGGIISFIITYIISKFF